MCCSWVVLSAFAALVGTGTVLGFVFVRGMVPSIDAVSFNTVGTSGYAGNANYSRYALLFSTTCGLLSKIWMLATLAAVLQL